ncbi:MAG: MurR/RpiR family transcriptional regulator [Bacilli bacterium]|jgi:DNA-binding MurR/RpiR family transcriptional regulator
MNNCIIRINESIDSFSKQELKIANYVLKHQSAVSQMTISELAKKSKSSTATIVRFANVLGFKGFRDFIKSFYHDVVSNTLNEENIYEIDSRNPNELSIEQTINVITRLNIEGLTNTIKIIDPKCVEKAVEAIQNAKRVAIYALSGSIVVADDAVFKFERLGIDCRIYHTAHSQILSATILEPTDVAIVISYSGETQDIIKIAEIANSRKAITIGITRYGDNSLSKACAINIHHSSLGKGLRSYSTRSRVVQHNIIDILFVALAQRRSEHLKKYFDLFNYTPQ